MLPVKQLLQVHALTMGDPSTNLLKLIDVPNKESCTVAHAFDCSWLCHYPRPPIYLHDKGIKFTGIEFQELLQSYGIKVVIMTTANPQTNAFLSQMHPPSNHKSTAISSLDVFQIQLFGQHPT
jgi:hypothetical protein